MIQSLSWLFCICKPEACFPHDIARTLCRTNLWGFEVETLRATGAATKALEKSALKTAEAESLLRRVIGASSKFADDAETLAKLSAIMDESSKFRKAFSSAWEEKLETILKANKDLRCKTCENADNYMVNLPSMDEMLDNVEYFSQFNKIEGFEFTFNQFSSGSSNFRDGLNHMVSYMKKHPDEFKSLSALEFRYSDDVLRRADALVLRDDVGMLLYEFKSWSPDNAIVWGAFFKGKGQSYDQFLGYLREINNIDELLYVFNLEKANLSQVKGAFKELFETKTDEIFNAMNSELKQSLFGIDDPKIMKRHFNDMIKDTNSLLYKFIK